VRDWAAAVLRCPACKSAVEPSGPASLRCTQPSCAASYPIVNGIPRMLAGVTDLTRHIQRNFGFEWTEYARFGWDDPRYGIAGEQRVFHHKSLLAAEDLKGRLVLDAGCGNGRYTHWAASYGGRVIGVDVSDAVEAAATNTADLPNVQIVQADIFNLPFAADTFDVAFAIGTLMCTGDAPRAFASVRRTIKAGGALSIHVYGKGNVFYEGVDRLMRMWTTRMSVPALRRFTDRAYRLRGRLQALGVMGGVGKIVRLDSHPHCIFDWYAAPAASHHTYAEVKRWFAESGVAIVASHDEGPRPWPARARQALIGGPTTVTVRGRAASG
jgi:SAM-dependent methyltransferase